MHTNEATSLLSSPFYTETYYEVTASFMIVTVATVLSTMASVNYHLQYRSSPSPSRVERILMKSWASFDAITNFSPKIYWTTCPCSQAN